MNYWPIASFAVNIVMALVIFSLRSVLRIAILELKEAISEKYATKDYVDQQVKLGERLDNGFAKVHQLLGARGVGERENVVR